MGDCQFNTYNPAQIHSHPGISTDLSSTSPQEILVTDFFGGVASVEVLDKEAMLPVLVRKLGTWETASERLPIQHGYADVKHRKIIGSQNEMVSEAVRVPDWKQVEAKSEKLMRDLWGGMVILGIVYSAYIWSGRYPERGSGKEKTL